MHCMDVRRDLFHREGMKAEIIGELSPILQKNVLLYTSKMHLICTVYCIIIVIFAM